jgi:hypothetical protein
VICDIAFCASGPWKLSRMIARPTTMPVPADSPWSARASHSDSMLPRSRRGAWRPRRR